MRDLDVSRDPIERVGSVPYQEEIVAQLMHTEEDNAPELLREISILVHMLNREMEVRPTEVPSMHASTRAETHRTALRSDMVMHLMRYSGRVAERLRRYY